MPFDPGPIPTPPEDDLRYHEVMLVIKTLDVLVQNVQEYDIEYAPQVLHYARNKLVHWLADSEYYAPVRDQLLRLDVATAKLQ